ncbi:MAG: endonuclease domain-containing protein [Pseudomonadota bacterium]
MDKLTFARQLRSAQTDAEDLLWSRLRAHRLLGLKFRRQQPLGPYVVDFFCADRRLVVELDGGQHQDAAGYDEARDAWLKAEGYVVRRYWNNELVGNLEGVLEDICRCAGVLEPPSPPAPLPSRERGDTASIPVSADSSPGLSPSPSRGEGRGEGGASS